MKAKKLLTLALAAVIAVASVVSVSAATLTDADPNGETEVKAHITGEDPEGQVSYIITIPDVIDFEELSRPSSTEDPDYKDVAYSVEATKVENLDSTEKQIVVYVRDEHATVDGNDEYGQKFWISNKANSAIKFDYHVYNVPQVTASSVEIDRTNMANVSGYELTSFTEQGQKMDGVLRIDQAQLAAYQLAQIVGEYSGHMVFFSQIEDI